MNTTRRGSRPLVRDRGALIGESRPRPQRKPPVVDLGRIVELGTLEVLGAHGLLRAVIAAGRRHQQAERSGRDRDPAPPQLAAPIALSIFAAARRGQIGTRPIARSANCSDIRCEVAMLHPPTPSEQQAPAAAAPLVRVDRVSKTYREGGAETPVLHRASLELARGETTSLTGVSGSGKSTLISLLAGPDAARLGAASSSTVRTSPSSTRPARARLRARRIGIVLQSGNLIPFLTAVENVELAIELADGDRAAARAQRAALGARARAIASTTCRGGCRAGRPSACRWRWRWRTSPTCCSRTR